MVHPVRVFLYVDLFPPDVPPGSEQEHDHHVSGSLDAYYPSQPLLAPDHKTRAWPPWCDDLDDSGNVDPSLGPARVCILWWMPSDMDGVLFQCFQRSRGSCKDLFVIWSHDLVYQLKHSLHFEFLIFIFKVRADYYKLERSLVF